MNTKSVLLKQDLNLQINGVPELSGMQAVAACLDEVKKQIRSRRKDCNRRQRELRPIRRKAIQKAIEACRQIYMQRQAEPKPEKPKPIPPRFTYIKNHLGKKVRVLTVNSKKQERIYKKKRKQILAQPHNHDMSTEPIQFSYIMEEEYATNDQNIPKRINKQRKEDNKDLEEAWIAADPRKRKSWQEFCRDFLSQSYGSIAQALLELRQDDPVQYLKYIMEMGKQGNPASMQIDIKADIHQRTDIFATLQAMSNNAGQAPVAIQQQPTTELLQEPEDAPASDENFYEQEYIPVEPVEQQPQQDLFTQFSQVK